MAKILKKTRKDEIRIMNWVAAEYNYLKEFEQDLKELKAHFNDIKSEERTLTKARAALRQIGRAERRVNRFAKRIKKDVGKLDNMLPENLKREGLEHEKQIEIAAKSILEDD